MPIFQNPPAGLSPEEYVAGRFLEESAGRSAGAYVAEARTGQNPDSYDENWADVADQFREQFPNINQERAQEIYQQSRQQSSVEGLTFTPQGGVESSERTLAPRIPIFGGGIQSEQNRRDTEALTRIREGTATINDYAQYREMAGHRESVANRSNLRAAGETIAGSLAFGADMAAAGVMTGGLGLSVPSMGRLAAATPLGARAAQGAIRGIGIGAAMPGRAMASVSEHMIPDVSRDSNGQLHIGGNRTWGDAFQGYLDHQIEIWSEMSGEALLEGGGRALGVLGRLPGAARAQAIASGIAARVAPSPGLRAALNQFGYTNMLGEFLEERAGEVARGVTGVSENFGLTGNVAAGRYREALNQLAVEGLAFGGMQVGVSGTSMALNRINRSPGHVAMQSLQTQGSTPTEAHAQVMAAAEAIANGTAKPEDLPPGPLRDLAESVQKQMKEAEKTPTDAQAAVEDAQSGEAPQGSRLENAIGQGTATYNGNRILALGPNGDVIVEEPATGSTPHNVVGTSESTVEGKTIRTRTIRIPLEAAMSGIAIGGEQLGVPAETSVPNETIPGSVEPNSAAEALVAPTPTTGENAGALSVDRWQNLSGFVRDNLKPLADIAEKNGVADKIEDLAAQRLTAKQISQKLGISEDMVGAVRINRGIPSMSAPGVGVAGQGKESQEFADWLKARKSTTTPPVSPQAKPGALEGKPKQSLPKRAAANLKGFAHDALKMVAEGLGVSKGGGVKKLMARIEKQSGGEKALAELPKIQQTLKAMAESSLIEGTTPVPVAMARAMEASKMHPSEMAALQGAVSGLSFDSIAAIRDANGKPVVENIAKPGKGVSHETARKYANSAFHKLKTENAGQFDQFPALADFLLAKQSASTENLIEDVVSGARRGRAGVEMQKKSSVLDDLEAAEKTQLEALKEAKEERDLYRKEIDREGSNLGLSKSEVQEDVERASAEELADRSRRLGLGKTPNTQTTPQTGQPTKGAKGIEAKPDVRFSVAADRAATSRKSIETYDSPTHRALVARLHQSLLDSPLPPRLKAEFGGHVSNVVANMPLKVATAVLQNVKGVKWFSATADLTQFVAETSSKAAEIMEQGKLIGGVYYPSLGLLYLDGDNKGESAAEIYAHEFAHALEGPTKKYSDSREWGSIFLAELSTGQLTTYGSTNQTEAFAEFGRAMYGEGQGATALAGKFPRATAFMVKHGLMPDSKTNFEKPSEIFETSINDKGLHGDVLFSVGPLTAEQAARAQISATGAAEPRVPQPLIQQAEEHLEDSLAPLSRLTAKQVPFGSAPQRKGADLRTVFWGMMGSARQAADKWFSQGVTQWRLNPDGTRTEVRTTKPATWITEGIDANRLQVGKEGETSQWGAMLIANHVVNEVETGSQMMQSKDEAVQAIGAKKVATASPEQVATFRAFLEDAKAKDPAWYAQAMESASRYTAYMNAMRQSLVAVGYHKQEDVDKMIAAFPDFVPLARVMDETPFKTELNKARKGSGRRFVDPLTTLRARTLVTNFFVARQLINNTLWDGGKTQQGPRGVENFWTEREKPKKFDGDVTDIDRALKALGMEEDLRAEVIGMLGDSSLAYMNTNPWHPTGENVYSMRIDGRPVSIEIHDRSLYEVLTGQQGGDAISNLAKAVAGLPGVAQLAKLQKGGATVTSIVFPVRNLFRDPWTYFQNAIPHVGFTQAFTNLVYGTRDAFLAKGQELLGKPIDKETTKLYFAGRGEANRAFSFAPRGEGEAALKLMRGESLGGLKGKAVKAINKVKDMLELWGAFEHAGRIAEHDAALREMGYTDAEIAKNKDASPNESPIPLHAMLYAQLRGAQSTTDFSKKGSWVKEWDKSVPFFGPHIAGVAQETRNWQEAGKELRQGKIGPKMKAMGGVMAVYLAMEILHWWKYKDDDWYNELDANQRYRWFILGRYGKGIAGIPKPHGLTTLAGAYLQELLRLESGNAARFDMATLNVPNELVPRAAPVGLGEAFQVARNTSWSGMPIVPSNEDRHLGDFDKWMKYRAPYILDQLSGGFLSERVFRMPWDALTASSVSPHQSVTDAYERLNQLDQERFAYRERGVPFPREAEYRRLNQITTGLRNISSAIRGDRRVGNTVVKGEPPSEERIRELRRRQVELARLVQTR